jgi:cold shock protein
MPGRANGRECVAGFLKFMTTANVKWFDANKHYGFINTSDGDVFVHAGDLPSGAVLDKGDLVEFEIESSPRGPKATKVKVLRSAGVKNNQPKRKIV